MQGVIARRAGITDTLYSGVKLNKKVKPYVPPENPSPFANELEPVNRQTFSPKHFDATAAEIEMINRPNRKAA